MNHLKCFIRQTILCLSVLCSSVSFAAKQVVIGSVQVPEGSSPLQVFITTSDQELLEKYSPQKLKNSEKLRALLNQIKESPGTVAKESGQGLLKIQGDFGLFASAVGLVSVQKLLTDYDRNPNALKAFWIHMIKDPFAWLSFYTFVVANRGSSAAYEALATKLGWIRDEKLFTQFMDTLAEAHFGKNLMGVADENMIHAALIYERAKALIPEPKFDFFLKELKAPFGLAAGIFLTGLTYDFISDPNVQRCATDWSNQNDQIINYCEVAYQEWLVHGRIVD